MTLEFGDGKIAVILITLIQRAIHIALYADVKFSLDTAGMIVEEVLTMVQAENNI